MIKKVQLPLQTLNLTLGFMVWVIISSLLPFIIEDITIPANQLALVTALPVVLGSILRIPIGYYANAIGARTIFLISFIALLFPVYYISVANSYIDLLIGGLFLGIGGAVFSVGVTSLPKYYPKEKHGFVNGIYGAGNLGTAISAFGAPFFAAKIGWSATIQLYLVILAIFIIANFFLGDKKEVKIKTPLMQQIKAVYKNEKLWLVCLFYFITFGSFVAFTIYLPNFLVTNFDLDKVDAGMRTAGFIVIATAMRTVGGWLGDRFNPLVLLMIVFGGYTVSAVLLSFAPSIAWYTFGCLTIAFCAGTGNGVIFKLVPMYFQKQAGIANGIVSAMGGLGGFFPPIILTLLFNLTGHYAIGFMALSQVSLASLILIIWMYYHDRISFANQVIKNTVEGIMITDKNGEIVSVNAAFTNITGYQEQEVLGKNPNILKSGKQKQPFYQALWQSIEQKGFWQGEIWNRRKDGEIYLGWLTISAIKDNTGEIVQYAGMFSDMTEERMKNKA
ncbi:nitrate/nitrite transporter [Bacillus sp. FJAT-50079]|uniref:MFS transporter n=1 Tax=Bacillus sp. FJAT-50079 TaxID=2833577 RepID=UPI001BC97543|nr:nitrate/nitrite transporter [Bacillus sp. FJAT-50079]MBS4209220.1 MFS transporter [Bacillus sp. FJAT-50079]